jgi:hypothetical protein
MASREVTNRAVGPLRVKAEEANGRRAVIAITAFIMIIEVNTFMRRGMLQ